HADVIGHAAEVIAYEQGAPPSNVAGYDDPAAALGVSPADTGTFGGTTFHVTPFNNPWSNADSVTVGAGGYLTLRLDRYAVPIDGPDLGVFVMQQFLQTAGGGTDAGPTAFYDAQFA